MTRPLIILNENFTQWKFSRLKLSRIALKPRNWQKFSPAKDSRYTVHCLSASWILWTELFGSFVGVIWSLFIVQFLRLPPQRQQKLGRKVTAKFINVGTYSKKVWKQGRDETQEDYPTTKQKCIRNSYLMCSCTKDGKIERQQVYPMSVAIINHTSRAWLSRDATKTIWQSHSVYYVTLSVQCILQPI